MNTDYEEKHKSKVCKHHHKAIIGKEGNTDVCQVCIDEMIAADDYLMKIATG
jgi:hypothetical protein